jgi:hypothetical protein
MVSILSFLTVLFEILQNGIYTVVSVRLSMLKMLSTQSVTYFAFQVFKLLLQINRILIYSPTENIRYTNTEPSEEALPQVNIN